MKERIEQAARSVKARARAAWAFVRAHPAKTAVLVLAPLAGVALSIKLIALIVGLMNATAQAVAAFLDRYLIGIGIAPPPPSGGWQTSGPSGRRRGRNRSS